MNFESKPEDLEPLPFHRPSIPVQQTTSDERMASAVSFNKDDRPNKEDGRLSSRPLSSINGVGSASDVVNATASMPLDSSGMGEQKGLWESPFALEVSKDSNDLQALEDLARFR